MTRFRSLPQNVTLAVHWVQLNSLNSIWQQLLLLRSVIFWRLGKKCFKVCYDFFSSSRVLSDTFFWFLWKYNYTSCSKQPQCCIRMIWSNSVLRNRCQLLRRWDFYWRFQKISHFFDQSEHAKCWLLFSYWEDENHIFDKNSELLLIHKQNL